MSDWYIANDNPGAWRVASIRSTGSISRTIPAIPLYSVATTLHTYNATDRAVLRHCVNNVQRGENRITHQNIAVDDAVVVRRHIAVQISKHRVHRRHIVLVVSTVITLQTPLLVTEVVGNAQILRKCDERVRYREENGEEVVVALEQSQRYERVGNVGRNVILR